MATLTLTRREGQAIRIGDNIRIAFVQVNGKVKVSVEAPPDVRILREELLTARQETPEV